MPASPTASEQLWLAIDQGTQSTRAALINGCGQLVELCQVPVSLDRVSDLEVEQDGAELVNSIWEAIGKVVTTENQDRIRAAGLATQRSSIIAWNRDSGETLSNVISWQDLRGHALVDSFDSKTAAWIQRTSGLPISPHYGASKIRWLVDRLRSQGVDLDSGDICIGSLSSFLLANMTEGKQPCQVDHANAGRTQLLSFEARDWDDELLACFGIPKSVLPATRPTQFDFGTLTGTSIPIRVCQGDQTAAGFGYGNLPTSTAHINLGTGGFMLAPVIDLAGLRGHTKMPLLISLANSTINDAEYFIEGTINGAGAAIKWAAEQLGLESVEVNLDAWAESVVEPPLFFNAVAGIGSPVWNSSPPQNLANRWFDGELNPTDPPTPEQAMVGVLESIVFLIAMNLDTMCDLEICISQFRLTGGVAKSNAICQRLADLSQCQIIRPLESESTLLGIACLLSDQASQSGSNWCSDIETGQVFTPRSNPALEQRYQAFNRLIKSLN